MISNTKLDGSAPASSISWSIKANMSRLTTDSADRLTPTWRPWAARRTACLTTHRSISVMRPYFSATPKKAPGAMTSPSRPTIRSRSSSLGSPSGEGDDGL